MYRTSSKALGILKYMNIYMIYFHIFNYEMNIKDPQSNLKAKSRIGKLCAMQDADGFIETFTTRKR